MSLRNRALLDALAAILLFVLAGASEAQISWPAIVDQPRPTGYFVGDLLTQRVLLERNGHALTPKALPTSGRVSAWFERRRTLIVTDASPHRWLVIEYQILNAPQKLTAVTLPPWQLSVIGETGHSTLLLKIPATSVNVDPLSPPGSPQQVGVRDLRPDHLPPVVITTPIRHAILFSAGAFVLTLIVWLGWIIWRNRRAGATQPFARALREMRGLDDREPRAWQALHRAFDRAAGRVVQSATLPVLFERAPQLTSVRAQIEEFFAQSNLLFFRGAAPVATSAGTLSVGTAAPAASLRPRALCVELRRIEKRNER